MARVSARRPLPALAFLLGLSILTALVWMRVWNRTSDEAQQSTPKATCAVQASVALPDPKTVTIHMLNATDRAGLAGIVGTQLAARGFVIADVNNDAPTVSVTGVAEIRYGATGKAGATLLTYYLPGAVLVPSNIADAAVTVSLGTAFKTDIASADQVNTAIAAAKAEATKSASAGGKC
jgi:hypothetical protein